MDMQWHQLLSTGRYAHNSLPLAEIGRSHFHKDYDRIVFSNAFRRLGGKTQVHPQSQQDHGHSRLVHSLEVGSVGRSLGIRVGERIRAQLPDWIAPDDLGVIVQSACLAHDIGNPPFGHAGEFAIRDFFRHPDHQSLLLGLSEAQQRDLTVYEGNAQGLRLATRVEYHLNDGGLRLTWPTLGALLKYPWTVTHAGHKEKFGCFQSERLVLADIAAQLGLIQQQDGQWCRHPLAYLMEAADDICYALIDLEDAVSLDLLNYQQVADIMLGICQPFAVNLQEIEQEASDSRRLAALRGKTMETLIQEVVQVFCRQLPLIMRGELSNDLLSHCRPEICNGIQSAKQLAVNKVFNNMSKLQTELGAYEVLSTLLGSFIGAGQALANCDDEQGLSFRHRRLLSFMADERPSANDGQYEIYMRILDFIVGMSDRSAQQLARVLRGLD